MFGSYLYCFLLTSTSISSTDRCYIRTSFDISFFFFSLALLLSYSFSRMVADLVCLNSENGLHILVTYALHVKRSYVWAFNAKTNKIENNKKSEIAESRLKLWNLSPFLCELKSAILCQALPLSSSSSYFLLRVPMTMKSSLKSYLLHIRNIQRAVKIMMTF